MVSPFIRSLTRSLIRSFLFFILSIMNYGNNSVALHQNNNAVAVYQNNNAVALYNNSLPLHHYHNQLAISKSNSHNSSVFSVDISDKEKRGRDNQGRVDNALLYIEKNRAPI